MILKKIQTKILKKKNAYDIIIFMETMLIKNKFFFLEETSSLFSAGHLLQIFIMLTTLVLSFFLFKGKKHWETPFFVVMAVLSNLFMLMMFLYSVKTGIYNPEWYFPAHICNLFMLIFPAMAISKGKIRTFLYDYAFYFGLAGCIVAISLPATTQIYFDAFSFISTLTWLYHMLLGISGIYLIASGNYFPKISSLWQMVAVFLPLAAVAFVFNSMWNTNFVFLNINNMYYPLTYFEQIFGHEFAIGVASFIVFTPFILLVLSISVLKAKNTLVSKVFANIGIAEFLKQHHFRNYFQNSKYIQNLKQNVTLFGYFNQIVEFIDIPTIKKCYNSIEEQVKNMTVGQLEDAQYVWKLIKQSGIVGEIVKQMTLKRLQLFVKLVLKAPVSEFLKVTNDFVTNNEKVLAFEPIYG